LYKVNVNVRLDAYQATFGQHIRYLRRLRSLTQEEVAHRAGVHVTYLSGIERGVRNPSLKNIRAIAEALGVPMGELFAPEPVASEPPSPEPVASEPLSPEPVVSEPVSLAPDATPTEISSAAFIDSPVSEANPIYPVPES
jgi:transcriptional regulator with XRE-family HTH domain